MAVWRRGGRGVSLRHEIVAALASPDLQTRIGALDAAASETSDGYAALVVQQIEDYPRDGYFVLERIGRFGPAVIPYLRALETATSNAEVLILVTLGLAHFKESSDSAVAVLLSAIRDHSEHQHLAGRALEHLGAVSAAPALASELHVTEPCDHHRITSLVRAIRGLGMEVATDEVSRLTPPGTPPWIVSLFNARGSGA
jgi:hypothetical protein